MLIASLALFPRQAAAQSLTLEYEQVVTRASPGATAAFSLEPSRVGASAENGVLTLVGRGPGTATVIVVAGDRTESIQVLVADPPRVFRPGSPSATLDGAGSGHYELRYGTAPRILQGNLWFSRREGDRWTELSVGGAAPVAVAELSPFSIPVASYTIRTPGRELTLFDRVVSNSPLTVSRSNVRGLHLREGPWQAHAGYSFFGTFEHLLLPTDKEAVAGLGYRHQLTPRSALTPNVYYYDFASPARRDGALGTLLFEARSRADVTFTAELGVGRAIGGALAVEADRPGRRAWATLRFAPPDLPALSTDQQSGQHVEAGWRTYGERWSVNASGSSRRTMQAAFGHASSVTSLDLRRDFGAGWSLHGGSGYSMFERAAQPASKIHSVTLPVGAAFDRRHAGFGLDYQFSRETTRDLAGHLVRARVNAAARGLRLSLHGERQTHAPTAQYILAEVPWLQPALDRLGLEAGTPQQLADLLRTNAELAAFGYENSLSIDLTPVRTRGGLSVGWGGGASAPQLFASTLVNRDELVDDTVLSGVHSIGYSQRIGGTTELLFSASALCRGDYFSACQPSMLASLRRTLGFAPDMLARRNGKIHGTVFQDDEGRGVYSEDLPGIAGVEVVLDGVRQTRTDASGRFAFERVPYGRHRVEARPSGTQPTFFTTPSPAEVAVDSAVHFGIGRALSSVRGIVRSDAGNGIPSVVVQIAGVDRRITASTTDDGSFVASGLPPGAYEVSIEAGSLPPGYALDALAPQRVQLDATQAARPVFVLQPYRTVSGRARRFDRAIGQYVAMAGAIVELRPLGRTSKTDSNGAYAFRNLPAGEYTLGTVHEGKEHVVSVSVPEGPSLLRNIEVRVVPGEPLSPSALRAGTTPGRAAPPARGRGDGANGARNANGFQRTADVAALASSFTIEVAASANARHARALVAELKHAGHAAYLVERATSRPARPYHVFVGNYPTAALASSSATALERILGWTPRVLPAGAPGE